MTSPQRLPASLTPLDIALDALLKGVEPVAPVELPLKEALRCIAAEMPPLDGPSATRHRRRRRLRIPRARSGRRVLLFAVAACRRRRYGSRPASRSRMACDCVLDSDSVDMSGPMPQVLAEAIPGQGVRRAGGDIAAGSLVVEAGRRVLPRDLLIARAAGIARLKVRRPRLRIVNIPGGTVTADLIAESARTAGAEIASVTAAGRDAGIDCRGAR